jgi:hypothetical protein
MWTYTLVENIDKENVTFTLPFMDGPFRLDVIKKDTKLTIQCIYDNKEDVIRYTFKCEHMELLLAVYRAIRTVLKKMYDNDMHRGKYASVYKDYIFVSKKLKTAIEGLTNK